MKSLSSHAQAEKNFVTAESDDDGETLLLETQATPRSARRMWPRAARAAVALSLFLTFAAAVACWAQGPAAKIEQVPGGDAGPMVTLDEAQSFTCSGSWPEPWFQDAWNVYCSKRGHKAWAMTTACNYAGWQWQHKKLEDAKQAAMSFCSKSGPCLLLDIDGNQCPTRWTPPVIPTAPDFVRMGPPFIGAFTVSQGPNDCNPTHCRNGINGDAVDFPMPKGTEIIAARGGTVTRIADGHGDGGVCSGGKSYRANIIGIKNADGTEDQYLHLLAGSIKVNQGDVVAKGAKLALSGNSGCSSGPHLHIHTLTPTFDKTVKIKWTFPCKPNNQHDILLRRTMFVCNQIHCHCTSSMCKQFPFTTRANNHWQRYCSHSGEKAWAMDRACNRYWYSFGNNAATRSITNCGSHCHDASTYGITCHRTRACRCNSQGEHRNSNQGNWCWLTEDHSEATCTMPDGKTVSWAWARCQQNGHTLPGCARAN